MKFFELISGASIPAIGLGTWKSDPGVVGEAVKQAIKLGYRHVDCAFIYGNEKEIGSALKDIFEDKSLDVKREDLFITSKLWNSEHAPEDVEAALRQSLSDLGLDYLDLYLIHWPVHIKKSDESILELNANHFQAYEEIPIADTWKALEACVEKGLVRDIGVSNFSVKKLKELVSVAKISPSVNQVERHPYLQNPELLKYCQENNIHLTGYSPLGSGDRPMKSVKDSPPILEDATIAAIAKAHDNATPAQVLLKWAIQCGTSVAVKSTNADRLKQNLQTADMKGDLTDDEMEKIKKLDLHSRYIDGTFWCPPGSPYTIENIWDEEHLGVVTETKDEL